MCGGTIPTVEVFPNKLNSKNQPHRPVQKLETAALQITGIGFFKSRELEYTN